MWRIRILQTCILMSVIGMAGIITALVVRLNTEPNFFEFIAAAMSLIFCLGQIIVFAHTAEGLKERLPPSDRHNRAIRRLSELRQSEHDSSQDDLRHAAKAQLL